MNLLFWNLYRKSNEQHIADLITENDIDIAIFSEYLETDFIEVFRKLNYEFHRDDEAPGIEKTLLICRKDIEARVRRDQSHYTIYSVKCGLENCIIAGIHLPSNPSSNSDDRKSVISDLVVDIQEQERLLCHSNTIVIGDFNASPFDSELIQKNAFNAVLFKELIKKAESVVHQGHRYKRFYNPMLQVFSEDQKDYGSFYYCSGIRTLYWYCYDQVIVRKSLVDAVKRVKYCKTIKNKNLLNGVMPRNAISDHLPLIVKFERS